jgi:hypothetical protein
LRQFRHKRNPVVNEGLYSFHWYVQNGRFLAVLRSFFHSSLLCTFSFHSSPPTILPSSLTSSCHLFLGLPLLLFPNTYIILFWEFYFLPFSVHARTNVICVTLLSLSPVRSPEGRVFDFRWCHWNSSLRYSFWPHYGTVFDSACNRSEYQGYLQGAERRPVSGADYLTTIMCRLSWNLGAWTSWSPQGLSRPVHGLLYHYILEPYTAWALCLPQIDQMYKTEDPLNSFSNTILMVIELHAMSMKLTLEFKPYESFPAKRIHGPFCTVCVWVNYS